MVRFEIKKIFSKSTNKLTMLVLVASLIMVSMLTINKVEYVDENGNSSTGIVAAKKIRDEKNQWSGYITDDVISKFIKENKEINQSKEALSKDFKEQNKAYAKKQGFSEIRDLITSVFSGFEDYDYYKVDSLTAKEASQLYEKRISNLKEYLNSGKEHFSDAEKEFLIKKYEELKTPFYYEYTGGWDILLQDISTFILIVGLVIGVLVSGIFSDEFHLKTDSIFFASKLGRNKAIRSKIAAGICTTTLTYVIFVMLYTVIVLSVFGFDGAKCPIQISMWKSAYNITYFQMYLLIVLGGYVGTLFAATTCMIVSAKTRSTPVAIIIPFILLCGLPFLSRIITMPEIYSNFPDQLFQVYVNIKDLGTSTIFGKVVNSESLIIPIYMLVSFGLQPLLYRVYKKTEII